MFRRKEGGLPKDPEYPANLKELGYSITDTGHIKKIQNPEEFYPFWVFNDERHNEVFREAMHECIRQEVIRQMNIEGVSLLYVPQLSYTKPAAPANATAEPNIPIFVSPPDVLRTRERLIVIVNDSKQDLGVWAYRVLSKEGGIDEGSAVGFMKELNTRLVNAYWPVGSDMDADGCINTDKTPFNNDHNADLRVKLADSLKTTPYSGSPGLVMLNPGQLLFSHRQNRAMTRPSWYALPQKSAVHPPMIVDEEKNTVPGNRTVEEHVNFVFDRVITNPDLVKENVHVYIVGILDGGDAVLKLLNAQWYKYKHYVAAIALVEPQQLMADITNPEFATFLTRRARAWTRSEARVGATLSVPRRLPVVVQKSLSPCHRDGINRRRASATDNTEAADSTKALRSRDTESGADNAISDSHSEESDEAEDDGSPDEGVICPTFSSGIPDFAESIFPNVYKKVLDFFDDVAKNSSGYRNPRFSMRKIVEEQPEETAADHKQAVASTPAPAPAHQASPSLTSMPPPLTPSKPTTAFTENPFQPPPDKEKVEKVSIAGVKIDRALVERAGFPKLAAERSTTSAPPASPISEAFRTLAFDTTMPGPSPTTRTSPYASTFATEGQSVPSTPTRPAVAGANAGGSGSPAMQASQGSPATPTQLSITPTKPPAPPKLSPSHHNVSPDPSKRPELRARRSELAPVQIPDAPLPSPPPFPGGAVSKGILGQEVEPRIGGERAGEGKDRGKGDMEDERMRAEQERKDSLLRKPSVAGDVSGRAKGE